MNKSAKILLALTAIFGSAYSVFWFSTAHDIEQIAQERFHMLQTLVEAEKGELYGNIHVQGFPFRFDVALTNLHMELIGKTDYTIKSQDPILLSSHIFGSEYEAIVPKKIHIEYKEGAEPHEYTILLDKPIKLGLDLTLRPIDFWVRYHVYQVLPSLSMTTFQGFTGIIPAGKIVFDAKTTLEHWATQSIELLQSPIDQTREKVTLKAQLGHIITDDAFYEVLKTKNPFEIEPEKWRHFIETQKYNVINKDIGLQLSLSAERSTGASAAFFNALALESSLGNEHWMLHFAFDLKTKLQKDPMPLGTGTILVTHPTVFLDMLEQLSKDKTWLNSLPAPLDMLHKVLTPNALTAYRENINHLGAPTKEADTLLFSFERNAEEPLMINRASLDSILNNIQKTKDLLDQTDAAKLHPVVPVAPPIVTPPPPDPKKLAAEKEQRVKKWVEEYEKNLETTLKATEKSDAAEEELIQQEETLEQSEKEIKAALEREKKTQEELKAFQEFQKNKQFAKPDA